MTNTAIVNKPETQVYTLTKNNKTQTPYVIDRKVFDLYKKTN